MAESNKQAQTNSFIGGMNMDLDYALIQSNQYVYAENVRVMANNNGTMGVLQGIEGFKRLNPSLSLPANETVIHANIVRDWGVIITQVGSTNRFYRYDFSKDREAPIVERIISAELGIVGPVSSVFSWESDGNVKMYFADGVNQLRMIHIDYDHNIENLSVTAESINIVPNAELEPLHLVGISDSGMLKSGKVQYAYQLFNTRGNETVLSTVSKMFHVRDGVEKSNSEDIVGNNKDEITSMSITIGSSFNDTSFNRARIYRIHYSSYHDIPTVTILDEFNISGTSFNYIDRGQDGLSEITVDELNNIAGYIFIPKVIEKKDNRLFAANIKEKTWDVSFDARAYRANSSGTVKITNLQGVATTFSHNDTVKMSSIEDDFDAINPYNLDDSEQYMYAFDSSGTMIRGGRGINISYRFVVGSLIELDESFKSASGTTITNIANYSFETYRLNCQKSTWATISALNVENWSDAPDPVSLSTNKFIYNYSSQEFDSNMRGYFRDEIYRFAIIFYNKYGTASPAHWIADIRMPKSGDTIFKTFGYSSSGGTGRLTTHPLGVEFTVNIPSDIKDSVTSWEIVRCDRTLSDRTILTQGVLSQLLNFKDSSNLVPFPYLSWSSQHGYYAGGIQGDNYMNFREIHSKSSDYISDEYFRFISPEISFNKENSVDMLERAASIDAIGKLTSQINGAFYNNVSKVMATPLYTHDSDGVTIVESRSTNPFATVLGFGVTGSILEDGGFLYIIFNYGSDNTINGRGKFYSCALAKYYKIEYHSLTKSLIDNIEFANSISPIIPEEGVGQNFQTFEDNYFIAHPTFIGDKTYYNYVWPQENTSSSSNYNNIAKVGPHGLVAIIKSSEAYANIPKYRTASTDATTWTNINSVPLCNLRSNSSPYGGESYAARQNSIYMSTGSYAKSGKTRINCFGGDTYIGVFDYATMHTVYEGSNTTGSNKDRNSRLYSGAYIPLETTINMSLRSDKIQVSKTYSNANYFANGKVQQDPISIGNIYSQQSSLYEYSDAYTSNSNALYYTSKGMYDISDLHSDARVMNSELKTNNEVIDSWAKFKVANYLDLDNQYGPITDLRNFRNELYYWQADAFGALGVNERSLITDNNMGSLTLGTGGTLERYSYITTKNGLRENQLRAHTVSDSTLYWLDADRRELIGYNGSMETISKLKGVQTYLNASEKNYDPILVYDKKYNEVLHTLDDKTLVFNEQIGAFTSFNTFAPADWFEFSEGMVLFNNHIPFKYNAGDTLSLFDETSKVSKIDFIVNENYPSSKTFDNVQYSGDFTYKTNFDKIYFDTKRQTSEVTTSDLIDYREDTYKFAIPRNVQSLTAIEEYVNMSYEDRMKGKYLVCHYTYDCNNGNTFKVPSVTTFYRYSFI